MNPIKILQFGTGNFLRCFIDWMVQKMNDNADFAGSVRIIQSLGSELSPLSRTINAQSGAYHTCLRGVIDGKEVEIIEKNTAVRDVVCAATDWRAIEETALLDSLRFVVSNTTEAGIEYRPYKDTFPYKAARLLKARFDAGKPGLVFIPCELIENNGEELKRCILNYAFDMRSVEFIDWIHDECVFCNTLVDRIVSGRPDPESAARYTAQLGERDDALVCGEPFHLFVIQTPTVGEVPFDLEAEFPLARAGVNVVYAPDIAPYRTRKVRFLNGAHTATVLQGILDGFEEVAQLVADPKYNAHFRKILFDEVFPTVDLPDDEKRTYAESVLERFANPFAHHKLLSIALNSVSKWKVRVLPTVLDYKRKFGQLPPALWGSLDSLIRFYRERPDLVKDSPEVVAFFKTNPTREQILANTNFWGMDLTAIQR